jgi:hypothetical protein
MSKLFGRRNSSVSTVGYGLDSRGAIPVSAQFLSLLSLPSKEYRVLSSGMKRTGREANHSPSSSAEVKMSAAVLSHMLVTESSGLLTLV